MTNNDQKNYKGINEDRDQLHANQDSGYHSFSSCDISNSNNNRNHVSENKEYYNFCPRNCNNCFEHGSNSCSSMKGNLNCVALNQMKQQDDYYNPYYAQNGLVVSGYANIPEHGRYDKRMEISPGGIFLNNNYTSQERLRAQNEELELKIEFCLKFGFSIEQVR